MEYQKPSLDIAQRKLFLE
jgi:hypothetical protein